MKEKMVEIDRLIIYSEYEAEKIKRKFIQNLKWAKLDDNTYQSATFFLKIVNEENKIIIDIWEEDFDGRIISKNNKFYHLLPLIQIRLWIKKWIKEIKIYEPDCKTEHTFTQIRSDTVKIRFRSTVSTIIILISTAIIMLIIIKFCR